MQIKTRKRNIAVALDPGSFADAVVTIFEDARDGDDLEKNLASGVKVCPSLNAPHACMHELPGEHLCHACMMSYSGRSADWGAQAMRGMRLPNWDVNAGEVHGHHHRAVLMPIGHVPQVLEATQLDFSRYGDTLFEVFFAGGRLAAGGNVVEEGKKLSTNVRTLSSRGPDFESSLAPCCTFAGAVSSDTASLMHAERGAHACPLAEDTQQPA